MAERAQLALSLISLYDAEWYVEWYVECEYGECAYYACCTAVCPESSLLACLSCPVSNRKQSIPSQQSKAILSNPTEVQFNTVLNLPKQGCCFPIYRECAIQIKNFSKAGWLAGHKMTRFDLPPNAINSVFSPPPNKSPNLAPRSKSICIDCCLQSFPP